MAVKAGNKKLLELLANAYPTPASELVFKNPYQLAVCVMLSAQCTDKKVNEVTPALFKRYPSFAELGRARVQDLEKIIRPVNYYKTKVRHLLETAKKVMDEFEGRLPQTHAELISLPGVGRKTANVILCELGIVPALPVDTHVLRLSKRLGLSQSSNPDGCEDDLKAQFPPPTWRNLHHWLILHGRRVCKARSPLCEGCILNRLCPSAERYGSFA